MLIIIMTFRLGYGYLLHSSGKCVHFHQDQMVLKDECGGSTGVARLQENGTLSFFKHVELSPFQFIDGNSLQDIMTNMCLVPTDDENVEPEERNKLTQREDQCGRPDSSFVFQSKYKGYGDGISTCESKGCRRLFSPSLKNVGWKEDAQLIYIIFRTFVCNVFPAPPLLSCQIYRQMYGK